MTRYRVVVGIELEAESADEAYATVTDSIARWNADRKPSRLTAVLGPRQGVYAVGGPVEAGCADPD